MTSTENSTSDTVETVTTSPKKSGRKRKLIVSGAMIGSALIAFAIGKAPGNNADAAAPAPPPAPVTQTVTKVLTPAPVTVHAPAPAPVTVTESAGPKSAAPAAEYQVVYKVFGVEGSPVGLTWNSAVYDATDPDHGIKQEDRVLPTSDITITAHEDDMATISASLGFQEAGKIERCEIWVNGVLVEEASANNAGTYVDCTKWL